MTTFRVTATDRAGTTVFVATRIAERPIANSLAAHWLGDHRDVMAVYVEPEIPAGKGRAIGQIPREASREPYGAHRPLSDPRYAEHGEDATGGGSRGGGSASSRMVAGDA
jgi:hypothetical protein